MRILLGFMVGALAMIVFHQTMWSILHILKIPKMLMPPAFPLAPTPPFGLPRLANACLWGGAYGSLFGLLIPRFTFPLWFCGLALGCAIAAINMKFFPGLTGNERDVAWTFYNWLRMMLLDGAFGLGLGILSPMFIHGSGSAMGFRNT